MHRLSLVSVLLVAFASTLGACGGDDKSPGVEPPVTPTADEIAWAQSICLLDTAYAFGLENREPLVHDRPRTTLELERDRAEILWPVVIELERAYSAGLAEIAPVDGAETLQQHMADYSESTIALMQDGLDNFDLIFATPESAQAHRAILQEREREWRQKIDDEFNANPTLFQSYKACTGARPIPEPTPE